MRFLVLVFSMSVTFSAFGDPAQSVDSVKTKMNGYALSDYPDFEKKWKLVTVRFRRDTGELRFTYANDLAYQTLSSGKIEYPDGAVFAKIGFATQDDPLFTSSAVPSGARRFQLMVRDKIKNKDTDGWGYALYDSRGQTFPENPVIQTQACFACHKVANSRGQVFSQLISLTPGEVPSPPPLWSSGQSTILKFEDVPRERLPESIQNKIPKKFKTVRSLQGPLQTYLFQGTLDEVGPMLAAESVRSKAPAVLISTDGKMFSMVLSEIDQDCEDSGHKGKMITAIKSNSTKSKDSKDIRRQFCHLIGN